MTKRLIPLAVVGFLFFAVVCTVLYLCPGLFVIQRVVIATGWPLTEQRVRAWLPPLVGKSLWSLEGADLVRELEKQPWVRTASIQKDFPDSLRIEIQTKSAKALWSSRGEVWIIDEKGKKLDKIHASTLKQLDLPVLSVEQDSLEAQWALADAIQLVEQFQSALDGRFRISELVLSDFPYFKVFLADYRLELLYSLDTWQDQISVTRDLLLRPPTQMGQPKRMNLVFPKKAVVSSSISQ